METVNIHQAKTHLSRLVERAERGEEIIIARSGRPVARLVPLAQAAERRVFGQMRGQITVSDDFDDPLPDDLLAAFYDGPIEPER
jgi:prevent-host-death family protein